MHRVFHRRLLSNGIQYLTAAPAIRMQSK